MLLLAVLFAAGAGMIAVSFVPYSVLTAKASAMSARGQVPFFNQNFYQAMQFRLRVIGLGNVVLAIVGIALRRHIYELVQPASIDFSRIAKDFKFAVQSMPMIEAASLFAVTVFAALLRFPLLFQPMRGDEAYTFLAYASHPFYAGLSFYNETNNHLFNTLLMRISYLLFGNHPWALRLPVFLAGICLVPAVYAASRCLYQRESALLAAGLVACSSPLIEYSTNGRGYSLQCLEFIVLIPLGAYALQKRNFAAWGLVAALGAIGFYTLPTMLYPFGAIAVWLLLLALSDPDRSARWRATVTLVVVVALAAAATIELYSPVFAISGPGAVFGKKLAQPRALPDFLHELPHTLSAACAYLTRDVPLFVSVVLGFGFAVAVIFDRYIGRQRISLAAATMLWLVVALAMQRVDPFPRVWLFALPLYLIVASAGCGVLIMAILERLRLRYAMVVVAMITCLLLGLRGIRSRSVYLANEGRGMEEAAGYLKKELKPGNSVVAVIPSDTLLYYHLQKLGVPFSYLNAPIGERALVIVNEHRGDTLRTVLETARLASLEAEPAKLVAKYDTASLYEISLRKKQEAPRF